MLTDNVLSLIGNTPLIQLKGEPIYAKAEFLSPGGSIKDRVALAMFDYLRRRYPDHPIQQHVTPVRERAMARQRKEEV